MKKLTHKELKDMFKDAGVRYSNRHDVHIPKALMSEMADILAADDMIVIKVERPEWKAGFPDGELINPS